MQNSVVSYLMCNMKIFYMLDFFFFDFKDRICGFNASEHTEKEYITFLLKGSFGYLKQAFRKLMKTKGLGIPSQ